MCTHLAKGICQVVCMFVILGVQNQVKGKSQAGGLGTGCRSRGPNQDKSFVFAFAYLFLRFNFLLCKFISITLISLFEC